MGPAIPFIHIPELQLPGGLPSIKPFGALVATGVYLGSILAAKRATERGLDLKKYNDFVFWSVASGFIFGHVLDAIFYHPDIVMADPLYLIKLWDGLSSFGGFAGGILGAIAWRVRRRESILSFCEVTVSAFPLGWLFGRMGCATVHDHPGRTSELWLAVKYPGLPPGLGRFDLGLYEALLTVPLVLLFTWLWRKQPVRPDGTYLGLFAVLYAPVRFALDFLRESDTVLSGADPRYAGLTPAQWACFALAGAGIYFLRRAKRSGAPAPSAPGAASS